MQDISNVEDIIWYVLSQYYGKPPWKHYYRNTYAARY